MAPSVDIESHEEHIQTSGDTGVCTDAVFVSAINEHGIQQCSPDVINVETLE